MSMVTVLGNGMVGDTLFFFGLICTFPFSPLCRAPHASPGHLTAKASKRPPEGFLAAPGGS